jgi:dinuclear metal center YbgI/SA1388 family protein
MTSIPTPDLIGFCDALLEAGAFDDYCPNGLQVPGPESIGHVVSGVSANIALFEAAARAGADLVLVHHGLFWGAQSGLDTVTAQRLRFLFKHDLALAAYHLPLDAHPTLGNNALLAAALGAQEVTSAFPHSGRDVGLLARLKAQTPQRLGDRLRDVLGGRKPLHLPAAPETITRVGVVTGSAADDITVAARLGCDAFITGEPAERSAALARELGVHLFAAGHHASEVFGVRALGERIATELGIRHSWVDIPNPV